LSHGLYLLPMSQVLLATLRRRQQIRTLASRSPP
jgi:hypothetical protein